MNDETIRSNAVERIKGTTWKIIYLNGIFDEICYEINFDNIRGLIFLIKKNGRFIRKRPDGRGRLRFKKRIVRPERIKQKKDENRYL